MHTLVSQSNPKVLRLGLAARNWLATNKKGLQANILRTTKTPQVVENAEAIKN